MRQVGTGNPCGTSPFTTHLCKSKGSRPDRAATNYDEQEKKTGI